MSTIKHIITKTQAHFKDFAGKVARMRKKRVETERVAIPKNLHQVPVLPAQVVEVTVSSATLFKIGFFALLFLFLVVFLKEIRGVIIIFFVSLLFAAALDPMVDALQRRKIPRALGVILIYLLIIMALGLLISNIAPIIANELGELAGRVQEFVTNIVSGRLELPGFLERFRPELKKFFEGVDVSKVSNYKDILLEFAQKLSSVAGNVVSAVGAVFNGFFNALLVLVLTFLMTVDEQGIDKFVLSLFPSRYASYISEKSKAIKEKIGYWLRGQILLCIAVGVLVYIGFFIIGLFSHHVEYSATIALVAGFTELIPYVGPFLAWLVALPIVANQSVSLIVWMTILMYAVQVLENNLLVPFVMNKAVGISPIFIMFAMLVGFSFLGILGMVLAVPIATMVAIFVKDYAEREK